MSKLFNKSHDYMCKSPLLLVLVIFVQLITVPAFSQNWSYATLEEKKGTMMTAVNGNKIYFYSGYKMVGSSLTRVDQLEIFDVQTGTKEVITLAPEQIKLYGATAVWGSRIFFGGGASNTGVTSRVDIYDTVSKTWTNTALSIDKYYLAGTAANGKVFFGGGRSFTQNSTSSSLDIYSTITNTWTTTYFPLFGGSNLTALSIGNKVIFAGGVGNASAARRDYISIYNAESNQWLPLGHLSQPRSDLTSLVYKNKAYFIGGIAYDAATNKSFPSETIDVYDNASDSWSVMPIPHMITSITGVKRAYIRSTVAGCKMFLLPDYTTSSADTIAIYDFARDTWSYQTLPHPHIKSIIAASGNKVYFAGGSEISNANFVSDIDILTLEPKLQLAVANAPVTVYDFGTVETGDLSTVNVTLSNEGDYDLLFKEITQRISISGDVDDFSIDPGMLQLTDTLEPAEIITLPVSFHPTTTGVKQIIITINSNDPNTPAYTLVVKGTAAEEDIPTSVRNPSEQNISVFPNPTSGMLHLNSKHQGTVSVQVINLQGQTVKKQTLTDDDGGLDISALPDGFYVVKITGDQSSSIVKVLKQ